jgi:hypothetical protein
MEFVFHTAAGLTTSRDRQNSVALRYKAARHAVFHFGGKIHHGLSLKARARRFLQAYGDDVLLGEDDGDGSVE